MRRRVRSGTAGPQWSAVVILPTAPGSHGVDNVPPSVQVNLVEADHRSSVRPSSQATERELRVPGRAGSGRSDVHRIRGETRWELRVAPERAVEPPGAGAAGTHGSAVVILPTAPGGVHRREQVPLRPPARPVPLPPTATRDDGR